MSIRNISSRKLGSILNWNIQEIGIPLVDVNLFSVNDKNADNFLWNAIVGAMSAKARDCTGII